MKNKNDYILVCGKCQKRIEKKGNEANFKWGDDSFKELKLKFKKQNGKKPSAKPVITSCLGPCPEDAITYIESKNGELGKAKQYPSELEKNEVFKLIFKD